LRLSKITATFAVEMTIYPSDFESKIGFNSLRAMVEAKCLSDIGRVHCANMKFLNDKQTIISLLTQTKEMVEIISAGIAVPLNNLYDPAEDLLHLKAEGSHIASDKFLKLMRLLETIGELRVFFNSGEDRAVNAPELTNHFSTLPDLSMVRKEIEKVVNQYGEVKDTASPRLAEIRREMVSASASMSGVMRRVIERAVSQGFIASDTAPSMRDGRLVIPVEAAMKRQISGIVHDQSASGKTYFIEPAEVVEANNRIRELKMEERKEIIIILISLSNLVRPYSQEITQAAFDAGNVDFIRAKALIAIDMDAQFPKISGKPMLEWYHATHPVLLVSLRAHNRKVVPLNIKLTAQQRILIISGPNAGGKSVCLKTVAILQYMMQCGMLPTLYSNSLMGIFDNIFIDIGDEQSIENDLSTYSSHLRNMKFFLNRANNATLFLADEMGSGTEPQIGGAIAQAILAKINSKGSFGVVTTHYQNLKTFASAEPGFVNGAMLYDRQHLQPLFQLEIGSPGSSFALEIAKKSGLPDDVINQAKELVGSDYVNMDKYLLDLSRDRRYWSNKRLAAKEKEAKIDAFLEKLEGKADELQTKRNEIIRQARHEAKELLDSANARVENAIKEIKAAAAEKERTKQVRKELESYRKQVEQTNEDKTVNNLLNIPNRKRQKHHNDTPRKTEQKTRQIGVGDYVRMSDGGVVGKVLSIQGNKAEVAFGALRTFAPLKSLVASQPPKPDISATKSALSSSTIEDSRRRQLDFKNEIDVRGFRADEALQAITYFLDDALQFSASRVRILHGTGTGALRVAIRGFLQNYKAVVSFHDEDVRFGGAGITVVNLE
jgi:DNA mismatch repair protein MutS2